MKRRFALLYWCFSALAPAALAQPAIETIATRPLPLRNLLIEVRQTQSGNSQQSDSGASGSVLMDSNGQLAVRGQVLAQNQQRQQSGSATQQVLVINGRSASIALRNSQPLRVLQSFVHQGRLHLRPSLVFLESGTGFVATPRWDGSDQLELTIAAEQAIPATNAAGVPSSARMQSSLVVPLGQWTTIAQSEVNSADSGQTLGGNSALTRQDSSEVQVRITLR